VLGLGDLPRCGAGGGLAFKLGPPAGHGTGEVGISLLQGLDLDLPARFVVNRVPDIGTRAFARQGAADGGLLFGLPGHHVSLGSGQHTQQVAALPLVTRLGVF